MLHILFLILKIIGIILAVILGLILLVICIILFVPICYKADLHGSGNARELTVHAKVSWLFGLIKAVFALENGKTDLSVRIAWKKLWDSNPVEDKAEDRAEEKPTLEKKAVMQENMRYFGSLNEEEWVGDLRSSYRYGDNNLIRMGATSGSIIQNSAK